MKHAFKSGDVIRLKGSNAQFTYSHDVKGTLGANGEPSIYVFRADGGKVTSEVFCNSDCFEKVERIETPTCVWRYYKDANGIGYTVTPGFLGGVSSGAIPWKNGPYNIQEFCEITKEEYERLLDLCDQRNAVYGD